MESIFLDGSEFLLERSTPLVEDTLEKHLMISVTVNRRPGDAPTSTVTVNFMQRDLDEAIPVPLRGLLLSITEARLMTMGILEGYEKATGRKLFPEAS